MALPIVGTSGFVIGADISPAMLEGARARVHEPLFWPVAADGQALPFRDANFDSVICQLGLQFFPNPALGLVEFRRVLRSGGSVAVCVISTPDKAPMWGILADALSRFLPALRHILSLSFALDDPTHALRGAVKVVVIFVRGKAASALCDSHYMCHLPTDAKVG